MAKHPLIKQFYNSKEWKQFRLKLINDRGNKCDRCGNVIAKSSDITGHHTIELTPGNVHDRMVSLNPERIELVCFDCHNKEHKRFGYQEKKEKNVYLVYGPPLSGKTTYVNENKDREDLVVDIDKLFEAVTLLPAFDRPKNLYRNVMWLHNQMIDNIKTRYGAWNNAWVVGSYPDKYKREGTARELGAKVIFRDVSKEECIARLDNINDDARMYQKPDWMEYISSWFERYTE